MGRPEHRKTHALNAVALLAITNVFPADGRLGGNGQNCHKAGMIDKWPRILSRKITTVSPWMNLISRTVEFSPGSEPEVYDAVTPPDYVSMLAVIPDGRIPIVLQYRPAIENFSWEFPAGLLEQGEDPAEAATRELLEETGHPTRRLHSLGTNPTDTGRLSNRMHSFFIEADKQIEDFRPEPGLTVKLVSPTELVRLIRNDQFAMQLHLGTLAQAELKGFLVLPR